MYRLATALLLCCATSAGAQERQSDRAFNWEGTIGEGHWLFVRNLNGSIRVERSTGSRVEVTATKRWRRGDPSDVRIEMKKSGDNVVICATWNERAECDENGYRHRNEDRGWRDRDRSNDTSVDFVVMIPGGVKLVASTVNGGLDINGPTSTVEASSVNGSIEATSSGGPVRANTVNGSIVVRMKDVGREDLDFETVNGRIEVWVPADVNADVDMRTVNGGVSSDFPMTVSGRLNPRRIRAQIGNGGPRLKFSTVNGGVSLRKN